MASALRCSLNIRLVCFKQAYIILPLGKLFLLPYSFLELREALILFSFLILMYFMLPETYQFPFFLLFRFFMRICNFSDGHGPVYFMAKTKVFT